MSKNVNNDVSMNPPIKASLFDASAKMTLGDRNEVLIEANKSRLLPKKLIILNYFRIIIKTNPRYHATFFSSNAVNKQTFESIVFIYVNIIDGKIFFLVLTELLERF